MKIFQPDIFSASKPNWNVAADNTAVKIEEVLRIAFKGKSNLTESPLQAGALEINSDNFKLQTKQDALILKRWQPNSSVEKINLCLKLLTWLSDMDVDAPVPFKLQNNCCLLEHDNSYWAFFPYVEGTYFSGSLNELTSVGESIGDLFTVLSDTPKSLIPSNGPKQLQERDDILLQEYFSESEKWNNIFDDNLVEILEPNHELLEHTWNRIFQEKINPGKLQVAHYDLHPHNILMYNGKTSILLDFDACSNMPVGYALAFSINKLCRQSKTYHQNNLSTYEIFNALFDAIILKFPYAEKLKPNLKELAEAEILRRITLILRMNMEDNNPQWNHVLPIQICNLKESIEVFKQ